MGVRGPRTAFTIRPRSDPSYPRRLRVFVSGQAFRSGTALCRKPRGPRSLSRTMERRLGRSCLHGVSARLVRAPRYWRRHGVDRFRKPGGRCSIRRGDVAFMERAVRFQAREFCPGSLRVVPVLPLHVRRLHVPQRIAARIQCIRPGVRQRLAQRFSYLGSRRGSFDRISDPRASGFRFIRLRRGHRLLCDRAPLGCFVETDVLRGSGRRHRHRDLRDLQSSIGRRMGSAAPLFPDPGKPLRLRRRHRLAVVDVVSDTRT